MGGAENQHQGFYGEAYVRLLALAAGLLPNKEEYDVAGVDFTIKSRSPSGHARFPAVEVQVKSWSRDTLVRNDSHWSYRGLDQVDFNLLTEKNHQIPRVLVLVRVPGELDGYADCDGDRMLIRHAAYWISLRDEERVENPSRSSKVTIHVPVKNLLTPKSLRELVVNGGSEVPHE